MGACASFPRARALGDFFLLLLIDPHTFVCPARPSGCFQAPRCDKWTSLDTWCVCWQKERLFPSLMSMNNETMPNIFACFLMQWAWGGRLSLRDTEDVRPSLWPTKTLECVPWHSPWQRFSADGTHLCPPATRHSSNAMLGEVQMRQPTQQSCCVVAGSHCTWAGFWRIRLMQLKTKLKPWFAGGTLDEETKV